MNPSVGKSGGTYCHLSTPDPEKGRAKWRRRPGNGAQSKYCDSWPIHCEHGHSKDAPEFKANACLGVASHSSLQAPAIRISMSCARFGAVENLFARTCILNTITLCPVHSHPLNCLFIAIAFLFAHVHQPQSTRETQGRKWDGALYISV